jgi:hypothetical protein
MKTKKLKDAIVHCKYGYIDKESKLPVCPDKCKLYWTTSCKLSNDYDDFMLEQLTFEGMEEANDIKQEQEKEGR